MVACMFSYIYNAIIFTFRRTGASVAAMHIRFLDHYGEKEQKKEQEEERPAEEQIEM